MNTTYKLREGLPELPERIARLPVSEKGYPIPFFVAYIDGKADFKVVDPDKMRIALQREFCWICGQKLGKYKSFVGGSLVLINRCVAEPAMHYHCAQFAVKACPFLLLPKAKRREHGIEELAAQIDTNMLTHNPTVSVIYTTNKYAVGSRNGNLLITLEQPLSVEWWTHGRLATNQEAIDGMNVSLEALEKAFAGELTEYEKDMLDVKVKQAEKFLPMKEEYTG